MLVAHRGQNRGPAESARLAAFFRVFFGAGTMSGARCHTAESEEERRAGERCLLGFIGPCMTECEAEIVAHCLACWCVHTCKPSRLKRDEMRVSR